MNGEVVLACKKNSFYEIFSPGKSQLKNADGYEWDKNSTPGFIAIIPSLGSYVRGFPEIIVYEDDGETIVLRRASAHSIAGWEYETEPDVWIDMTPAGIPLSVVNGINRYRYTIQKADALPIGKYKITVRMGGAQKMEAIDFFNSSVERAKHLLELYDLLYDTRSLRIRSDWIAGFNKFMHWPQSQELVRIDGKDKNSLLIIKKEIGIDRSRFTHTYMSELLRAALVMSVSAMDNYFHEIITERCWNQLSNTNLDESSNLNNIKISIVDAKNAVARKTKDSKSRPGGILKKSIQTHFQSQTYQGSISVENGLATIGIKKIWKKVSVKMDGYDDGEDVKKELNKIVRRRNQIVHESDIPKSIKLNKMTPRDISHTKTKEMVDFLSSFILCVDDVVRST